MLIYIAKRLAAAVATLLLIMTITFFLMNTIPGSPFLTEKSTPQQIELANQKYGLDKPLIVQLKNYLVNYCKGDLGVSLKMQEGTPVKDILFRQGKFVFHHCGFGTTAASMIYGIPSVPVPHVLDQLGFAMQLEKKDVAVKHIDAKDLSEQTIIAAIEEMNSTYAVKKRNAESISEKIADENGLEEAVRLISDIVG